MSTRINYKAMLLCFLGGMPIAVQGASAPLADPAAVAAPNTLPALELPALEEPPAPQKETAATSAEPVEAPVQRKFSYGDSDISILFLPAQMEQLKSALRAFEIQGKLPQDESSVAIAGGEVVTLIPEPPSYPVFFLSTLAYETPNDWAIWVSGHKITAKRNDTDLRVISITRDYVTLAWKPEYIESISRRKADGMFAAPDAVKHKLAVQQDILLRELKPQANPAPQTIQVTGTPTTPTPQDMEIVFRLRQNQSFAVGYFKIFEGYMDSPSLAPLVLPATAGDPAMEGMPAGDPMAAPQTNAPAADAAMPPPPPTVTP